jgi:hypothetical protein
MFIKYIKILYLIEYYFSCSFKMILSYYSEFDDNDFHQYLFNEHEQYH